MPFIFIAILSVIGFHIFMTCSKSSPSTFNNNQGFTKPDIEAFLFYGFIRSFFSSLIVYGILFIGIDFLVKSISQTESLGISSHYLLVVLSLSALFSYISLSVKYHKEQYFFHDDKLIYKGGSLFSDFERELSVKNITHVTMMLPFVENKLFNTGYVRIESAGALTTEIFLRSVANPRGLYENVIRLMKKNGFKLSREKLVEQERPHSLAVFFEVFRIFFGFIFLMVCVAAMLSDSKLAVDNLIAEHGRLLFNGIGLIFLGVITFCFFRFMDLKKRIYDLYEDTIAYTEGFLNKNYSFIPIENLADSAVTQSILSRIFGLYDLKISCQGSSQEILFKNMKNGEKLSNNIDELVSKTKSLAKEPAKEAIPGASDNLLTTKPATSKVEPDREYKNEFRMETLRTWVPAIILSPLLIVIFPVGIIVVIGNLIAIACNVFRVKADTIEHTFNFLSKKTKEFSLDKVTGIVIKESFIDKWCQTVSILFWSIGSGENIVFSNIKKTEQLCEKILAKKGIRKQKVLYSLNSAYDVSNMIKGNLYLFLFFASLVLSVFIFSPICGLLASVFFVISCLIGFIYRTAYYQNSKIVFYQDYVQFTRGLFFVENYFVYYNDIKDISTTKFPFSNRGNLSFNVAGETIIKTQQGQNILSNAFTIRFVDDITTLDELIDAIFYQRPSVEKINEIKSNLKDTSSEPEYSTKPCLANYLLFLLPGVIILDMIGMLIIKTTELGVLASVWIFVLLLLSILMVGIVIAAIKAISYNIQSYRVYERSGIIFKKQLSITFNKMDFINFSQGPINKIFENGNITINTTGSSRAELTIRNIKDFKKFYEIVKSRYK